MTMKVRFVHKGGKGSGNFGHSGRPGKVGGSAGGGKGKGGGGARSGVPQPSNAPAPEGYSVKFYKVPGYYKLPDSSDEAMENLVGVLESAGVKFQYDHRTNFPSFDYYEDGEEIGGG